MKLIKTKLLVKYNHNSAVGIATSSHIDFCKYQVKSLKSDDLWSLNAYEKVFSTFICSFFVLLLMPFLMLTNGLILYPFWFIFHIVKVKKIIKEFGVDHINSKAKELIKELENENI